MLKIIVAYAATLIAFAAIDSVWLITMAPRLYKPEIGAVMLESGFRLVPALLFYSLYIAGILYFAVLPGLGAADGWRHALVQGAVLGLLCYATYDLTNYATLRVWSLKVTVLDLLWGTLLTGGTAAAGTAITGWILQRFAPA